MLTDVSSASDFLLPHTHTHTYTIHRTKKKYGLLPKNYGFSLHINLDLILNSPYKISKGTFTK